MKISNINNLSFTGKIYDSHVHIGHWTKNSKPHNYEINELDFFLKEPLDVFVKGEKQQDTVEKAFISSLDCMIEDGTFTDEFEGNLKLLEKIKGREEFVPLAVCQPNRTLGDTTQIKALLDETDGKFVGFKFHPSGLQKAKNGKMISASHSFYDTYLAVAEEKKLPCLFHSQADVDWDSPIPYVKKLQNPSDPGHIYELAKRHKTVPVIMGHTGAGAGPAHKYTIDMILESIDKKNSLLYADISWMDWADDGLPAQNKNNLIYFLEELKKRDSLDRVLFGTDAPLGCYGENLADKTTSKEAYEKTVGSIKTAIKTHFKEDGDEIIDKVFYQNAHDLFIDKKWANRVDIGENVKKLSKTTIGAIAAVGVIAFVGLIGLLNKNKKQPQQIQPKTNYNPQLSSALANFKNRI